MRSPFSDTRESAQETTVRTDVQTERCPFGSKTGAAQRVFWCPIRHKPWLELFAELGRLQQFSLWTLYLSLLLRRHELWCSLISPAF